MHDCFRLLVRSLWSGGILCSVMLLAACGSLAAALPARPTPFPTLERLPSVTPAPPSATPLPTSTSTTVPTPSPVMPYVTVPVQGNMRSGPGTDFDVVMVVQAESTIRLRSRQGDWYEVQTLDGQVGWMSDVVLRVPPDTAIFVPES